MHLCGSLDSFLQQESQSITTAACVVQAASHQDHAADVSLVHGITKARIVMPVLIRELSALAPHLLPP